MKIALPLIFITLAPLLANTEGQVLLVDCPESVAEQYEKLLPRLLPLLPKGKADPAVTLAAVMPRACYLELADWQLKIALQLAHYGLFHGLKPATVSDLTEALSWHAISKEAYLKMGKTYEQKLAEGVPADEIAQSLFEADSGVAQPNVKARRVSIDKLENQTWSVEKLDEFFRLWHGTPYKWGGVTQKGVDCSGFVIQAIESQFSQAELPRSARKLAELGKEVQPDDLKAGDLVFFTASEAPGRITHVGIFIKDNSFAHASSKRGVTLSRIDDKYYAKRLVTARRLYYESKK